MRKILFWLLLIGTAVAQQVNTNIIPASPGLNLGTSNQRWNAFLNNLNISGSCTLNGGPCFGGGGVGSTITVNGSAAILSPNFQDGTGIHFSISGNNVIAGLINTISPSTVVCPTITYNAQGQLTSAVAGSCSGGGGSPGGSVTNLQFNDSTFGGAFNFTFNKTTGESQSANLNKIRSPSPISGTTYNFQQIDIAGSIADLSATGTKTLNLTCSAAVPCIGMDTSHSTTKPYSVYIATTGTPEAALVTGGTCGLFATANCTVIVVTTQTHGAGFTVGSAYGGIQEAINDAGSPNARVVLQPVGANTNAYQIFAPIYFPLLRSVLEGTGSWIKCFTRSICLFMGDPTASTTVLDARIHGLRIGSGVNIAGVGISNTERTGCPGACQINITTSAPHPFIVGDYIDIQMTYNTAFWGVWKITSSADNTHFTALYSAQINNPSAPTNIASAASTGQVALLNAGVVDNAQGTVMDEVQFESGSAAPGATGLFHNGIVVFDDEAAVISNIGIDSGSIFRCDSTYCANAIYGPGPFSPNPNVMTVYGKQISLQCHGNGITNYGGNTLGVHDIVIQGFGQWGINNTTIRGGFGRATISNVYNEVGACVNPQYSGSGNAARAEAGLIGGGRVIGGEAPVGNSPLIDCVGSAGSNFLYYWVVIKDSVSGTSAPLFVGNTNSACSGNATIQWPRVQGTNTITYDVLRTGVNGGGSATAPYIGGCAGGSILACGSVATAQAQCSAQVCSFTDNSAANTTAYTVVNPNYFPELYFWPGAVVLSPNSDTTSVGNIPQLYADSTAFITGQSQIVSEAGWLVPTVHALECTNANPGSWITCLAENSATNNSLGATVLQGGIATGGNAAGNKGRLNFNWGAGVPQGALITLVDSNPSQTWASANKRPTQSITDTWLGSDLVGGAAATNAPLSFHSPLSVSTYIATLDDGSNWVERLNATKAEYKVGMQLDTNLSILGSCLTGCGPFTPFNPAADNFNRPDGACGANWTITDGACNIVSNKATYTFGGDSRFMGVYSAISFANDQCAQVIVDTVSTAFVGLTIRGSTVAETGYFYGGTNGSSTIGKVVAGVRTTLLGGGPALVAGDAIQFCAVGTALKAYRNFATTPVLSTTDAAIASGNPGLWAENTTAGKFDFWSGGDAAWTASQTINVQNLVINGTCTGCATGTVTASGTLTATAILTGNGTTVVTAPSATTTLSAGGDVSTPGSYISTAANGGIFSTEGTGNCTPGAGIDCMYWDSTLHGVHLNTNNVDQGVAIGTRSFSAVYNHSGTQATTPHVVQDRCTLGTDCSVTLTGSAVYTSSSTYDCTAIDRTSAAAVKFVPSSGSAFALTGTGTDTISYLCVGN